MKVYHDRLTFYHDNKLIARHARSFDRNRDFEDPDHPKELIARRKKAHDQLRCRRFLALSPRALDYNRELDKQHLNVMQHVRTISSPSEIHGDDAVIRAIDDALALHAIGSSYIAKILESRARSLPEPGALHLTRLEDLLDLDVEPPDLSIYQNSEDQS